MKKQEAISIAPNGTKVMHCGCQHAHQDKLHGAGMRVFNRCRKGWRCTVCGHQTEERS